MLNNLNEFPAKFVLMYRGGKDRYSRQEEVVLPAKAGIH